MGKNQITTTETESQGQGVCEKIFKALTFQSSRRNSHVHSRGQSYNSAASKPTAATTDRYRNDPAKSTLSKPVALHQPPAQSGSTIPLQLKGHQIPLHEKDKNMVLVEYNHNSGDTVNKPGAKIIATRGHQQNQDPKGIKAEPVSKSPVRNMVDKVHKLNEDSKVAKSEDYGDISSGRFTRYIDHVKSKMITLSSLDDDGSSVGRAATRRDSFKDKLSL